MTPPAPTAPRRLDVILVPALSDNYIHLLRCAATAKVAVVDPAEAAPVVAALEQRGWGLDLIVNTHHHGDHVGGNLELKARFGAAIVGPAADRDRIPGIDRAVADGESFTLGACPFTGIDVPGHTRGHIAFHGAEDAVLFSGDTLFSLGCGRLFEGTPDQMWHSLTRLRALPAETAVYCGHEYTAGNGRFALTLEPDNADLAARMAEVTALRAQDLPTLPTTLAIERATNPFLRADLPALAAAVGLDGQDPVAVFAEIRRRKDNFRG
ncbi:hydroxyacylglutathione hydrolase [Nitrospirillum amazonense]|uniref:Hydroxyacylglutathione hydrolase n=1 Tax=Nitrospirillum amazonense TaxID=28077 RepID=A0A560FI18_9PROT|nr:hydroxyacylglutathione hydrolase [Nitrospirillum amazonense]TWB21244.1 hydroxyacylglutathione hydrolase [Nitrospirillum amazonense]